MSEKPKITSSEIGTLWATYREKTFIKESKRERILHLGDYKNPFS